ncbi:adenylate cyclase [Sphingopyxis sp. PAMC25046]|uniref:adenylate cyclase n=1 Tax=Sphingopyxis sp. PAMC25046 TaxID=2565556 RepID=UPI00109E27A7|nr:adenylate cyclase [Sphingopyxis sp. PAMC25046]QCB55555.1 adenylate cyclase [Sphingopyxis sp. PAMC25046]
MATTTGGAARVELFWHRMAIGLAIFIIFGFLQFALRGFVDPVAAPFWVHVHGVAMLAWLALLIAQPTFVSRDNLARHRQLGRIGGLLAIFITGLGIFTGVASLILNRFPPFFTPPYFLALTVTESLAFGAIVAWALRRRRATDWHRRLMIGATIVILEPALGRLLPMPLMIGWSDIPVGLVQLGVVGIVALYDRRTLGRVHPATKAVAAVVIAVRLTIYLLSMTPPVIALAERLAGG